MSDIAALVDDYIAAWNETDERRRAELVALVWTEDGCYTDPLADVRGHDAVGAVLAGAREQFAGLEFALLGGVDAHHGIARFRWRLGPSGGESVVEGADTAVLADDGRLAAVYGFLDKLPAA